MTREEHLDWAKKRALECCELGQLQRAMDSLISDLAKHEGTETLVPDWAPSALEKWMAGEIDTADKMRAFINGVK